MPIRAVPEGPVAGFELWTDQKYKALDIRSARLKVGGFDQIEQVTAEMAAAAFTVDLKAGETDIKTWLRTADDKTLGAYYLSVRRIE